MCTGRGLIAGVARTRLPYAANMVPGVDAAGCACGAGPGAAEAAAGLVGIRCQGRGNFDYLQVSFPRPGPLISFSEMVDY